MDKKPYIFQIALLATVLLWADGVPGRAEDKPAPRDKVCKNEAGVAAGGYDVVSYFSAKRPELGSPLFTLKREGAEYRFVSTQHRDQFAANPDAYLPQYGGHCSWALSKGKTMASDPQAWLIHKGKLYLVSSRDALSLFEADVATAIRQADEIWKRLY